METATVPGPGIELLWRSGDTSGRFEVARVVARVFPARRDFVQRVIGEGIMPAGDFPFGAFPDDRLDYRDERIVEYETPANSDGIGMISRLQRAAVRQIRGVAILENQTPDLLLLAVRLPSDTGVLTSAIVAQVEQQR